MNGNCLRSAWQTVTSGLPASIIIAEHGCQLVCTVDTVGSESRGLVALAQPKPRTGRMLVVACLKPTRCIGKEGLNREVVPGHISSTTGSAAWIAVGDAVKDVVLNQIVGSIRGTPDTD